MRPWPLWLEFFYKSWTFPPLNMLRQVPLSSSENVWESIWTPNISWDFLKRGSFHTSQGIWMILKDIEAGKPPKRPKCSIQKFQDFIGFWKTRGCLNVHCLHFPETLLFSSGSKRMIFGILAHETERFVRCCDLRGGSTSRCRCCVVAVLLYKVGPYQ